MRRYFAIEVILTVCLGCVVLACGPTRSSSDDDNNGGGAVQCSDNDGCASDEFCDIEEGATSGVCQPSEDIFNNPVNNNENNGESNSCERGTVDCLCTSPVNEDPDGTTCTLVEEGSCDFDSDCEDGQLCDDGSCTDVGLNSDPFNNENNTTNPDVYRFVLLEDVSSGPFTGDSAGADIDGVCIERDGVELGCATSIEDANLLLDNNSFIDTAEALGVPDSECLKQNYTAMGGEGAYMVMGFGDVTFESGDDVIVYELSSLVCENQPEWVLDPVFIGVSASTDLGSFVEIGSTSSGQNVIEVP